jgi:hypothetical protein
MQLRVVATALILAAILTGCGLFDSGITWSSGKFEVLWIDLHSSSHLAYRLDSTTSVEVVESCVTAAGANDQYIAVKRLAPDSSQQTYYIVARAKYKPLQDAADALIGPLSEVEFLALGRTSSLPPLKELLPVAACNTAA